MTDPAYHSTLHLTFPVGEEAAAEVLAMVRAGFGSREVLDPPSTALTETEESIAAALAEHGGLVARTADGEPQGALLFEPVDGMLGLRRVSVHPDAQARGVAQAMVRVAEGVALERGYSTACLLARVELPRTVHFWQHRGYVEIAREGVFLTLARELPITVTADTADETRELGRRLARVLRAGDLVLVSGLLGAGKTTLAQGLGEGLGVRGPITSPTFVISRVHPSLGEGPAMVHVDAYRLDGAPELDDLDLDTSLEDAVTVVEWGTGIAEGLSDTRLEVAMAPDDESDRRSITFTPVGQRWIASGLRDALA